jgi:hypothetical protein
LAIVASTRLRFTDLSGKPKTAKATLIAVEIVCKNPNQVAFAVNPRRWVVERFFAWIGRNRRLAKDFEATIDFARAFLYPASVIRASSRSCFMTFETDSQASCALGKQLWADLK